MIPKEYLRNRVESGKEASSPNCYQSVMYCSVINIKYKDTESFHTPSIKLLNKRTCQL